MGARNVVTSDVGGTSFDVGLVVDQSVRNYEFNPVTDCWMVAITLLQSLSIGAGGAPPPPRLSRPGPSTPTPAAGGGGGPPARPRSVRPGSESPSRSASR